MAYDARAQEFVLGFYLRGWSKERSLPEIRKVYPGFSSTTWEEWEKKYEWKDRRALADARLREFDDLCRNASRVMLLELDEVRRKLMAAINEGDLDTQTVYAYTSVVKQMDHVVRRHMESRPSDRIAMQVINAAIEKLLRELGQVEGLGAALEDHASEVGRAVTAVAEEFGQ